jgi:hypothetical protein
MLPRGVFVVALLAVPGWAEAFQHLQTDTVWRGSVVVRDIVVVEEGVTLTIEPGTVVKFAPRTENKAGGGLVVYGKLLCLGTPERRVRFTVAGAGEGARWGEVRMEFAGPSVLQYADFERATWGLHVHFTPLQVRHCTFRDNHGGIRFRSGPVLIEENTFEGNHIAIRSFLGKGQIRFNRIVRNDIGIFISQGTQGIQIQCNRILGNHRYNLRIGDFEHQALDVKYNWWGSTDEETIEAGIYDGRREQEIGLALYRPYLRGPECAPLKGKEVRW